MNRKHLIRRFLPRNLWGDRLYGRYKFHRRFGRYPEEELPVRFNDHLFALKTSGVGYDPLVQFVTDKEYAKLYVGATIGEEYTIRTYKILRNRKELTEFLPDRFPCVLKPTHSSGLFTVCTDPQTPLDQEWLAKWFDIDHYERSREHNYRHLVPKIIVEEFFSKDGRTVPKDYKIFCFRGVPRLIQVDSDRFSAHTRNFYDTSWNRIPVTFRHPGKESDDAKPSLLGDMLLAAQKLSAAFSFIRVDMYAIEGEIRIGELTFVPESAGGLLNPPDAEFTLGAFFRDGARQ